MSLFDFAKEVGRSLFDTDAEAADNIRDHLNVRLAGVRNLKVEFDDGVATICGDCPDEATRCHAASRPDFNARYCCLRSQRGIMINLCP